MPEDVIFGDNQQQQETPETQDQEENSSQAGPDQKMKKGSVHLAVWHNENSPDTYSFKRFYTQDDGQTFQETQNMRPQDLQDLKTLINYVQLSEVDDNL